MEKKTNWSRWHPKNPLKSDEREVDSFFEMFPGPYKKYNDPSTVKGDIIEDYRRTVQVRYNKYRCPHCHMVLSTQDTADYHANQYGKGGKTYDGLYHPPIKLGDLQEIEFQTNLPAALIYYEVVRPEEILPHEDSPEWLPKDGGKEFHALTPAARERHDSKMKEWREQMKITTGKRKLNLEVLPNGDIQEKGTSGKWWYWCPQEYYHGCWIALDKKELATLDESKQKIRVLYILAIIPADLEVAVPSFETPSKETEVQEEESKNQPSYEEYHHDQEDRDIRPEL